MANTDSDVARKADKVAQYVSRNGAVFEGIVRAKQGADPGYAFLHGGDGAEHYLRRLMELLVLPPAPEASLAKWDAALSGLDGGREAIEGAAELACSESPGTVVSMMARLADRLAALSAVGAAKSNEAQWFLYVAHATLLRSTSVSGEMIWAVLERMEEVVAATVAAQGDSSLATSLVEFWKASGMISEAYVEALFEAARAGTLPPVKRTSQNHQGEGDKSQEVPLGEAGSVKGKHQQDPERKSTIPDGEPHVRAGHLSELARIANGGQPGAYQPVDPEQSVGERVGSDEYLESRLRRLYEDLSDGGRARHLAADRAREREHREREQQERRRVEEAKKSAKRGEEVVSFSEPSHGRMGLGAARQYNNAPSSGEDEFTAFRKQQSQEYHAFYAARNKG